jgi:hypothetical protein
MRKIEVGNRAAPNSNIKIKKTITGKEYIKLSL